MDMTLDELLEVVGKLDDTPGMDTPRERFRSLLQKKLTELGQVRDYVQQCLAESGDQYSRALQDLVNHIGTLLGFEVAFGRYHGVRGEIGFDGHWKSPSGFHLVIEVKTTEAYSVKTATLVGYVDRLISAKQLPNWEKALGLYVIGRPDPEIRQLENAILAEKRTNELRIVSLESLLSLAEMMSVYDITHDDVLSILRPSSPVVDSVVTIMSRLAAQREQGEEEQSGEPLERVDTGTANYIITPTRADEESTGAETIQRLVGQKGIYAFGERTPCRRDIRVGDWICFYATTVGVVAHARVASLPEKRSHPAIQDPDNYPWVFDLSEVSLYTKNPVVIDAPLRSQLDKFKGRDADKNWAWFVQATRRVTQHDFRVLTRQ